MIDANFIILILILVINLGLIMVKKESVVIPAMVTAIFSVVICIYYVINISGLTFNIESLFCGMVAVISAVSLVVKGGLEKY